MLAASSRGLREVWIYREAIPARDARRLFGERLAGGGSMPVRRLPGARAVLRHALRELGAYFRGDLRRFSCPLDLRGRGTPLEARVRAVLAAIPYGERRSYAEVARAIRRPRAVRAVGRACSRNPLPVILPCHRVVGSDGSLTGFAGGLSLKALLLDLEGARPWEEGTSGTGSGSGKKRLSW